MSDMMITGSANPYAGEITSTAAKTTATATEQTTGKENPAAVFEKTTDTTKDSANKIYNRDAIVSKLKMDQESRMASMQSLVEKLLNKQKGTFDLANFENLTNLASTFREAAALASPEEIAQAQADVAEDGYWGVEQTSDRLVSMAIALSGGDTEKADMLKDAIQKGFDKATAAWGEDLPQLCQDTLDATMKKMDDWKNGVTTAEDYSKYLS